MSLVIRPEAVGDHAVVHEVNRLAFEQPAEADLVESLRGVAAPMISLVAEQGGTLVGHILFTPISVEGEEPAGRVMGLAPMAVHPDHQRQGVGSALVRAGLEACRDTGCEAVVVLGHPAYYPRFGFRPASAFGIQCPYDVPDEVFMATELEEGALARPLGLVRYRPEFDGV